MSLIQEVTLEMLTVQEWLPDRELNQLYRFIAMHTEVTNPRVYILQWSKDNNTAGWKFVTEQGESMFSVLPSIREAIEMAIEHRYEVHRISNSNL